MRKLTLIAALLLTTAAAAHAQSPTGGSPSGSNARGVENDSLRDAQRKSDGAKAGEALISASHAATIRIETEADAARRNRLPSFKAQVEVTNHAAKTIQAVEWTATLIDPGTGAVIRSYDVTTETSIAPGKTRKLSKFLQTPRARIVSVKSSAPGKPAVADLKVKVTGVTYADGTTSTTP